MTPDIEAMRKAADGLPVEEWRYGPTGQGFMLYKLTGHSHHGAIESRTQPLPSGFHVIDATDDKIVRFLALCDPRAVLALIARLHAAEAERDRLKAELDQSKAPTGVVSGSRVCGSCFALHKADCRNPDLCRHFK